ncbi:MAG: DnaJ family molecular chaperone [Hyphomicrobiaceae bacterium]
MIWQRIREAIGLAEGGRLRAGLAVLARRDSPGPEGREAKSATFTAAVVALSAKMAQADGAVVELERRMFERLYPVDPHQQRSVHWLFELATHDVAGFETYARQIATALAADPDMKRDVLEGLFHIAIADGVLHDSEEIYLARVAHIFGFSETEFRAIRALFVADPEDPYVVLGVAHGASDAEVKAHYRQLVRENHPDAMMARGLPTEFVAMADRTLAAINAAYDQIARERDL